MCPDAKFGSRYDGTNFPCSHPNSTGRFRWKKCRLPLQHTSCSHKVLPASIAIANSLHRARMTWIVEHPRESWLWDVPKIQALETQLRAACRFQCFSDHNADSERRFRLETWTAGICTVSHEGVLEQVDTAVCQDKHVHSNACASVCTAADRPKRSSDVCCAGDAR